MLNHGAQHKVSLLPSWTKSKRRMMIESALWMRDYRELELNQIRSKKVLVKHRLSALNSRRLRPATSLQDINILIWISYCLVLLKVWAGIQVDAIRPMELRAVRFYYYLYWENARVYCWSGGCYYLFTFFVERLLLEQRSFWLLRHCTSALVLHYSQFSINYSTMLVKK